MAGEVLAEVKRQRYTYKEIQERSGVKSRAWGYYFREGDRSIPFPALAAVCEVLGVKPSEMVARAEARLAAEDARPAGELDSLLTANAREGVERGRADVRRNADEGEAEDPPDSASGRRRSA